MRFIIVILFCALTTTAQTWNVRGVLSVTNDYVGRPTPSGGGGGGPTIVQTNVVKIPSLGNFWSTNVMSVTSNNVLAAVLVSESDSSVVSALGALSSSQGITWTKQADAEAASSGNAEIWTSRANATGTIYITNKINNSSFQANAPGTMVAILEISGCEQTLAGATTNRTAQTAPILTFTTTRTNSLILMGVADWNAKAPPVTYRLSAVEAAQHDLTTSLYRGDVFFLNATSAAAYIVGESAPTAQASGFVALELRIP